LKHRTRLGIVVAKPCISNKWCDTIIYNKQLFHLQTYTKQKQNSQCMDNSFITLQQTHFVSRYKHCGLLINGRIIVVTIVHHSQSFTVRLV